MEPDENLLTYLDRIKDIVDQLTALESTTEDKELCYKIVATLTSDYEPLVMQLKDEQLKLSYLQHRFALEETRNDTKGVSSKQSNALMTETHAITYQICTRCGLTSHTEDKCRTGKARIQAYEDYKKMYNNDTKTYKGALTATKNNTKSKDKPKTRKQNINLSF